MKKRKETLKQELKREGKKLLTVMCYGIIILIIIVTCSAILNAYSIQDAVVWSPLNQNQTNQTDLTLHNINFTRTGTAYSNSGIGTLTGCINYTGVGDGMLSTNPTIPNSMNTGNATITLWIKPSGKDANDNIFYSANSGSGGAPYNEFMYDNLEAGKLNFALNGFSPYVAYTNPSIETWTMITVTSNTTGMWVYYNKTLVAQNISAVSLSNNSFKNVGLGYQLGSATRAMNGCIAQFGLYNFTFTQAFVNSVYDNLTSGNPYPFYTAQINITLVNQTPVNITSLNIIGNPLQINYNISDAHLNTSVSPWLNYTIGNGSVYVNGSLLVFPLTKYFKNTTDNVTYLFTLDDNQIYPATYNVNELTMENTPHSQWITTSNNQEMKVNIKNISTDKNYNIFEAFVNINTTGSVRVWYCNTTYVSGNPSSNNNCVQFGTIATATYNHSHNNSYHNIISMPMISGTLGGINVTSNSYIIFDRASGSMQIGYINGSVRTNVTMTTTNSGISWTDQNWTADMHIHQYNGTETLSYYACYNQTATTTSCSGTFTQNYVLNALPPTEPHVALNNYSFYYNDTMTIYFTNSTTSISGINISYYNMTMHNTTDYLFTISNNATNNTNFTVNGLPYGDNYYVYVVAKDTNGSTSTGISNAFNVYNKINSPCNATYTMNSTGVPVNFDFIMNNNSLFNFLIGYKNIANQPILANTTGTHTLIGLDGLYTIMANSTYSTYQTSELTNCTIIFCNSNWINTTQPCISNLKIVLYNDNNSCIPQYNIPNDNGTYVSCVTPPNTDKDLWVIILLIFFFIVLVAISVFIPYVAIGSLILAVFIMIQFLNYFTTTPIIVAVLFPVIAVIIGAFSVMYNFGRNR
jgi:hypothetical protein